MLSRQHRFHGYGSLRKVYNRSQSIHGPLIGLRFASRDNKPYRVAVVVGRKVNKSAVKRNSMRRRIFEAVRNSKYMPDSTDLIITVYSDQVAELTANELEILIDQMLQKINQNTGS